MHRLVLLAVAGIAVLDCGGGSSQVERQRVANERTRMGAQTAFDDLEGRRPRNRPVADAKAQTVDPDSRSAAKASENPPAEYDLSRYMVGVGTSRQGPTEAERLAISDLTNQICSTVKSDLTISAGLAGGKEFETIVENVTQHSRFGHGELIRLDRGRGSCSDGVCRAYAVLDRTQALEVLGEEYRRDAVVFRRAAESALRTTADVVAFTPRFREAEEAFGRILPLAMQMRVIGNSPYSEAAADEELFRQLLVARGQVLAGLQLVIRRDGPMDRDVWEALGNALPGAFGQMGLAATTGEACIGTLSLAIKANMHCERSYFGPRCSLESSGLLTSCNGGLELATLDLGSSRTKLTSAHPRQDDLARRATLDKITANALMPVLRTQLLHVLPIR